MVFACILVSCEAGRYKEVAGKLKKTKGMKKSFGVNGRWDVVAEIEAPDLKKLGEIVLNINGTAGVKATETLVSLQEE